MLIQHPPWCRAKFITASGGMSAQAFPLLFWAAKQPIIGGLTGEGSSISIDLRRMLGLTIKNKDWNTESWNLMEFGAAVVG
jgi:hypothetical protein